WSSRAARTRRRPSPSPPSRSAGVTRRRSWRSSLRAMPSGGGRPSRPVCVSPSTRRGGAARRAHSGPRPRASGPAPAPLRRGPPGARGRIARVERFLEKPERARAAALLREGGVLWNAGIFAWRVEAILAALRTHLPRVLRPLTFAIGQGPRALAAAYRKLPAVALDRGVLAPARGAVVLPAP